MCSVAEDAPLADEAVVLTLLIRVRTRSCPCQTSTVSTTLLRWHTVLACSYRLHLPVSSNIVNSSARCPRQSTFQCRYAASLFFTARCTVMRD